MKIDDFWLREFLGDLAEDFANGEHNDEFVVIKEITPNKLVLTFDSNCGISYASWYKQAAREWFEDIVCNLPWPFRIHENDSLDNDSLIMEIFTNENR